MRTSIEGCLSSPYFQKPVYNGSTFHVIITPISPGLRAPNSGVLRSDKMDGFGGGVEIE